MSVAEAEGAVISVWFRAEGKRPEKVDEARTMREAEYLAREYAMAFAVLPGQHRAGKDKVWAGRRDGEPGKESGR